MYPLYSIFFVLAIEGFYGAWTDQPFSRDVGLANIGEDILKLSATSFFQHKFQALDQKLNEVLSRLDKQRGTKRLCPTSWTRFGNSCYKINTEKKNWASALLKCRDEGGYLAEIDDEAEGQFLKEEAMYVQDNLWLGGSDIVKEGDWHWVTSKKKISTGSFTDWPSGQPSNGHGGEGCLHFFDRLQYRWNDISCAAKYGYICEMQIGLE